MAAYTSGDSVYFNNMTDKPKKHYTGFVLKQRHDMYITSQLKIIEGKYVLLPKILCKKLDECQYPNCFSVIKIQFIKQI